MGVGRGRPVTELDRFTTRRRDTATADLRRAIEALHDARLVLPHRGPAAQSITAALMCLNAAEHQITEELK